MPVGKGGSGKPGSLKEPDIAALFENSDPERRFTDLREIGHGSFGAVYFAYDLVDKENVAIKKMSFAGKTSMDKWNDILKEVRFFRQLSHPNCVSFRHCFLKDSTAWLSMEYCVGSAADIVEVHKAPLKETEIAAVTASVLAGLVYLHEQGRIHRDIKAGNILLTDGGEVKLGDFGSASVRSPAGSFVGTPYWMAPEVILAMEEGQYDARADVWSLGITCMELAERRPPLFSINAMSALYHIAQNPPPTLARPSDWSPAFVDFVGACLVKEPSQRLHSHEAARHAFLAFSSPSAALPILQELIARTKHHVRELDNFQYRKLRKLMILDDANSSNSSSADLASIDSEETDSLPPDDDVCSSIPSSSSAAPNQATTIISVGQESGEGLGNGAGNGEEAGSGGGDGGTPIHFHQAIGGGTEEEAIATLRRSRFNTIRTARAVRLEQEGRAGSGGMAEAMIGYKRLRQLHQKELRGAEERCRAEMATLKAKLDQEYELLIRTYHKEMHKLHSSHQAALSRAKAERENAERKLLRSLRGAQEKSQKAFAAGQRREYKRGKEAKKSELRRSIPASADFRDAWERLKSAWLAEQDKALQALLRSDETALAAELKTWRRQRLIQMQELEGDLLREELRVRARHMETNHGVLQRHHAATEEQEARHLKDLHQLKSQHLATQHQMEWANQVEYTRKKKEELAKTQAAQSKQQPRELKAKEIQIRKQFNATVKTQTRQYKLLQTQLLRSIPREEHKEIIGKLKEEQKRKLANLTADYDATVAALIDNQTLKLESVQSSEAEALAERLQSELDLLTAYQSQQRKQAAAAEEMERTALAQRVALRAAVLRQKMADELSALDQQRSARLRQLSATHQEQMGALEGPAPAATKSASTQASPEASPPSTPLHHMASTPPPHSSPSINHQASTHTHTHI